jgi:hypothetical protein
VTDLKQQRHRLWSLLKDLKGNLSSNEELIASLVQLTEANPSLEPYLRDLLQSVKAEHAVQPGKEARAQGITSAKVIELIRKIETALGKYECVPTPPTQ